MSKLRKVCPGDLNFAICNHGDGLLGEAAVRKRSEAP